MSKPEDENHDDGLTAKQLEQIARLLDYILNPHLHDDPGSERLIGFTLNVFPFNVEDGFIQYVSNAQRLNVVAGVLRRQLATWDALTAAERDGHTTQ